MASFALAAATGVDALECDVHLTRDGHVVVIHDPTLDRTTDRSGAVAALTLAEVREADAGARFQGFAGTGERVPLLAEVLDAFPDLPFIVEFKSRGVSDAATKLILDRGARDRVLVGAFDHATLQAPRAAALATAASRREAALRIPGALLGFSAPRREPFDAYAITPSWNGVPIPVRRFARVAKVPVHVWTVDDADIAERYWRAGVTGIITNDPATILERRRRL